MDNFEDFVEQVRDANPIEDVLLESGIHLRGHGRLRTSSKHDSMKVRTDMQRVFWYSQNWNGDVFAWVMREKGLDFGAAIELLARRAHIEMPKFQEVNDGEVKRNRATADVFSVAANVFHRWLVGDEEKGIKPDDDALAYVRSRAWTDETIKDALNGFSGRRADWQYTDMRGELQLYGIQPLSLAGVAVLGFQGDVDTWARAEGIRDHEEFDESWIEKKHIHGLMDTPGLIYAHYHKGGVKYLSRRQLPGFDKIKDHSTGKQREWKSFNPYKLLAGPKQPYFNHVHRVDRPLVLVEGQGDAQTWGQWGHGSMAFCGLLGDIGQMAPEDAERFRRLAAYINKHPMVYLALDDDEAGQKAIRLGAKMLGPQTRIVRMTRLWSREDATQSEKDDTDAKE
jgi:DNA primase